MWRNTANAACSVHYIGKPKVTTARKKDLSVFFAAESSSFACHEYKGMNTLSKWKEESIVSK